MPKDDCWLYAGSIDNLSGYAQIWDNTLNRNDYMHRIMYENIVGKIPEGLQLDHLCRIRRCINPTHLEPVTARTNVLRGEAPSAINARKTHCIKGHELVGANVYHRKDRLQRGCRTCRDYATKLSQQRKRGYQIA